MCDVRPDSNGTDGTLYLPDDNEGITAIVTPEKGIMPNAWAMYTRDPQRSNSRFNYVPADTIAPVLAVTEPGDNLATSDNQTVTLSGTATDQEDGDISQLITWRSNIDGELGAGASVEVFLSAGFHTITAKEISRMRLLNSYIFVELMLQTRQAGSKNMS